MTKKVRIENADTNSYKVIVQTWVKGPNGEPDAMIGERELSNPCDIVDFWIWQEQYLVIKENS